MLVEPIDELHEQCLAARDQLRARFHMLQLAVEQWEPEYPAPAEFR